MRTRSGRRPARSEVRHSRARRPPRRILRRVLIGVGALVALVMVLGVVTALVYRPPPAPVVQAAPVPTRSVAPRLTVPAPVEVPPPAVVPTAPAGAAPAADQAAPAAQGYSGADESGLSPEQQREYLVALIAAVPAVQGRLTAHGGNEVQAALYVTRDGVRLCGSADPNLTPEARAAAVQVQVTGRFPGVEVEDVPAVLEVTDRLVCGRIS